MSEWERTTLGEVASVVGGGTPSTREASYWGGDVLWLTPGELTKREGHVITGTERRISAAGLASSSAKMLPKDAVLLTSRATVGAVGLAGQPMTTNQGFQSLIAGPRVLPRFLMNWVQANRQEFESRASGSTFPEISGKKIKTIPLSVPPLAEQRRIVDVMAAVDRHIEALIAQRATAEEALSRLATEQVALPGGDGGVPLDSLLLRNIGGAWGSEPGTDDLDVDVYRSTEFTNWGILDGFAEAQRSVAKSHHKSRALEAGDILIEKSGGTPARSVGRVVTVQASDLRGPTIGANFLQLLRADSSLVLPRYLFWLLWGAHRRGDGFEFQSASTNIRNLQTKSYLARRVVLPVRDEQVAVAEALDAVQEAVLSVGTELTALRAYRATLLSALLSQQVEIPESYDALLDDASEVPA